ncbi:TPA: relaxase/mobilization nuclease domain-containing protein [Elizabethkingia anophelis]
MIIKILKPSVSFHGVDYNDRKVNNGSGELMKMKNFPSFINEESSKESVRNYLKSISINEKVKKPQFHAVISTKFQSHSKEDLTNIADKVMDEMGYGKQPFIIVFHNDTDNNHVHIVSTRVDKDSGKKINDSYEKLKSQKALSKALENQLGLSSEEKLNKLLKYNISSEKQLITLLEQNGFKCLYNKENESLIDIFKNGIKLLSLDKSKLDFMSKSIDSARAKQIKAILYKYKESVSNKVFRVFDDRNNFKNTNKNTISIEQPEGTKISFESELQKKVKDVFGIEIVFHSKDNKDPFGYTLIDNKSSTVYKGSEILSMKDLFEFTNDTILKNDFEVLKDYNIPDKQSKAVLLDYFNSINNHYPVKDYMIFDNKIRKDIDTYRKVQSEVRDSIKNDIIKNNNIIEILKSDDKFFCIHPKYHYVSELSSLIGDKDYQIFMNPDSRKESIDTNKGSKNEYINDTLNIIKELTKSSATTKDPGENEMKKRRKKRK